MGVPKPPSSCDVFPIPKFMFCMPCMVAFMLLLLLLLWLPLFNAPDDDADDAAASALRLRFGLATTTTESSPEEELSLQSVVFVDVCPLAMVVPDEDDEDSLVVPLVLVPLSRLLLLFRHRDTRLLLRVPLLWLLPLLSPSWWDDRFCRNRSIRDDDELLLLLLLVLSSLPVVDDALELLRRDLLELWLRWAFRCSCCCCSCCCCCCFCCRGSDSPRPRSLRRLRLRPRELPERWSSSSSPL
mmetsp:Transcript_12673/g.29236  ORF Transcript_12673/g.29236 Transcript_12673/m.29236 type:complete len:242 (+) Transcript_12673:1501-2226(+)